MVGALGAVTPKHTQWIAQIPGNVDASGLQKSVRDRLDLEEIPQAPRVLVGTLEFERKSTTHSVWVRKTYFFTFFYDIRTVYLCLWYTYSVFMSMIYVQCIYVYAVPTCMSMSTLCIWYIYVMRISILCYKNLMIPLLDKPWCLRVWAALCR